MRIGQMAVRRVLVCNKSRALTRARDKHTPNLSGPGKRIKQEAFRARHFAASTPGETVAFYPRTKIFCFLTRSSWLVSYETDWVVLLWSVRARRHGARID